MANRITHGDKTKICEKVFKMAALFKMAAKIGILKVDAILNYLEPIFGLSPCFNRFSMLQNLHGPIFTILISKLLLLFKMNDIEK